MGKTRNPTPTKQRRCSSRLQQLKSAQVEKKKPPAKKAPTKAKKAKPAENGNTKPEEPKAEAIEAK